MDAFLGLDAGGTRTRALLVNREGTVLGWASGPTGHPNNHALSDAVGAIAAVAAQACNGSATTVRSCFAALAGVRTDADCRGMETALRAGAFPPVGSLTVANDTEAALAGGLAGRPGIVLVAGTGSFSLGRDAAGTAAHSGGWGWLLDDAGSGFWLGRETLHAVVLAADTRGPATALTSAVLTPLGLTDVEALLWAVYPTRATPTAVAQWAPVVLECAARGDAVAGAIAAKGAQALAGLVAKVAGRLAWSQPPPVALCGGVVESSAYYRTLVTREISAAVPGATVVLPELPPVAGAALRALEGAGIEPTPTVVARLKSTLSSHAS